MQLFSHLKVTRHQKVNLMLGTITASMGYLNALWYTPN